MAIYLIRTDNSPITLTAQDLSGNPYVLTGASLETHVPLEGGDELVFLNSSHSFLDQTVTQNKGVYTVALKDQNAELPNLETGTALSIRTKITFADGTVVNVKARIWNVQSELVQDDC